MTEVEPRSYELNDRYERDEGTVYLSGVQALARIFLEQLRVDRTAGLNTAALLSGYPGSPLAGFDGEAAKAAALGATDGLVMVSQPGLNEELAAAAVMGSQLAAEYDDRRYDGVIGAWYGKAPGVDRAADAIRHGVYAGASRHGGAVVLVGDDPMAKSSTLPSSSDPILAALRLPTLVPGDAQEILDLGRHAIAMSRSTGAWTALRVVAPVAEGSGTVHLDSHRITPVLPGTGGDFVPHPDGRLINPYNLDIEAELFDVRLELARAYGALNALNRVTTEPISPWLGIAASGNTYHELLEAFRLLGIPSLVAIADLGVRLLQIRQTNPMDPEVIRQFGGGLAEILVVEDKDAILEGLIRDALYPLSDRPVVVGRRDERGQNLIRAAGGLVAEDIVEPLRTRLLSQVGEERLAPIGAGSGPTLIPVSASRTPYFCSGCPHNWGTKVPDDSLVGAGIGCQGMIALMDPERVGELAGIGAMGGEGAQWVGMSPFLDRDHFLQNLGDGTYFHSGQLAVQFAVAAGVNVTFKLLYNGTIAMTGGQDPQGAVSVPKVASILLDQGVAKVLVTTDDLDRHKQSEFPGGVEVWDRSRIVEAQERLRQVPGVTVLIHEQGCAAQLRRARKRGKAATPSERVLINPRVCEGCGDCGDVSGCLSLQPVQTEFGRKTAIDQTSCNLDYSCLKGDCPAFATVIVADPDEQQAAPEDPTSFDLPDPDPVLPEEGVRIRIPGIGGTGVVTVAQILGTAAMFDGLEVRGLDQTGLSQKAGSVVSDVLISRGAATPSNKASAGTVDLYLAFDLLVAASPAYLEGASAAKTVVVGSVTPTATGTMVVKPETPYPEAAELQGILDRRSRAADNLWMDAGALTTGLFGDNTTANVMVMGAAVQAGALPVSPASIEAAIELNGVGVELNRAAFARGRQWVLDRQAVETAAGLVAEAAMAGPANLPAEVSSRLDALVERTGLEPLLTIRAEDLTGYQSARYAADYLDFLATVADAEAGLGTDTWDLTSAVAFHLHKLLAYKDEYEVARLLLDSAARRQAEEVGGRGAKVYWHLHPPTAKALGRSTKSRFGPRSRPALEALRRAKRLRGTRLDMFGRSEVRRLEQRLPGEYMAAIRRLLPAVSADNLAGAVEIAQLPDQVRGYEELKLRRAAEYSAELERAVNAFS